MANDHVEHIRIVQETVAGKEITFAHVMSAMTEVVDYFRDTLGYVVCKITKR